MEKWEAIPDMFCKSQRLKVPGGWVVRSMNCGVNPTIIIQTFVEDRYHTWGKGDNQE